MKNIFIFFLFLLCFKVLGYDTTAVLTLEKEEVEIGEIVKGRMRVFNIQKMVKEDLKKIEGEPFLEYFRIVKIESLDQNKNNPQVWDINFEIAYTKSVGVTDVHIWSWKALNIPVEFKGFKLEKGERIQQKVVVLDTNISDGNELKQILLPGLLFLLAIGAILYFFVFRKGKQKNEEENWKEIFTDINTREEFESIYRLKDKWGKIIPNDTPCKIRFIEALNACQYKREWNDIELHQVQDAYDELKTVIEKL